MKRIITLLLLCFLANGAKAQLGTSSPFQKARDYTKALEFSGGWFTSQFLNENYQQNLEVGNIDRGNGAIFRTRLVSYPFLYDFEWFSSKYDLKDDHPALTGYTSDNNYVRHRGIDLSMSLVLIPTSKHITPYVGFGYQLAEMGMLDPLIGAKKEEDKTIAQNPTPQKPFEGNVKMNTTFWKAGIMITPSSVVGISAEFRNSVGLDESRAFNQFSITLNWRRPLGSYHK
jgi:hypothetical protein